MKRLGVDGGFSSPGVSAHSHKRPKDLTIKSVPVQESSVKRIH